MNAANPAGKVAVSPPKAGQTRPTNGASGKTESKGNQTVGRPKRAKKMGKNGAAGRTRDRASIGSGSGEAGKPGANPSHLSALGSTFAHRGAATNTGEAGTYKKGNSGSSTVEGILRNQGYSLKEIYSKGKDGSTLVDQFNKANGLKDARHLRDGQKYVTPEKPEHAIGRQLPPLPSYPTQAPVIDSPAPATPQIPPVGYDTNFLGA